MVWIVRFLTAPLFMLCGQPPMSDLQWKVLRPWFIGGVLSLFLLPIGAAVILDLTR